MDRVGLMPISRFREEAVSYLNDAKLQSDTSAKTNTLKRLKEILLHRDPSLLQEFVPHLMELQTERSAPVRNYLVQLIQEIGLKFPEHISVMAPVLLTLMRDDVPAVARHAISAGSTLFRSTFEQVALQGIYAGQLDENLQESWSCMSALKDTMYLASKEHKNDGVRLLAIKFIEMVILLFTPEPNGLTQPPPLPLKSDKASFNVAWLHGGHPVLDVGSLGQEASKNLSLLLDQLRGTEVLKIPGPVAVVLVNSLASIGKQRPSLYGRVLPVLLGLVPNLEVVRGVQATSSIAQALKNAFVNLLKCTHSGAGPWRERVISALRKMKEGDGSESTAEKAQIVDRARPTQVKNIMDEHPGKRLRLSPARSDLQEGRPGQNSGEYGSPFQAEVDMDNSELLTSIKMLVAKGEQALTSVEVLIAKLPADVLADIVIENMKNLPQLPPAQSPRGSIETNSELAFLSMPFSAVDRLEKSLASSFAGKTLASTFQTPELVSSISDHRRDPRRDPRLVGSNNGDDSVDAKLEQPVVDLSSSMTDSSIHGAEGGLSLPSSDDQMSFIPGISQQTHLSKETRILSNDSHAGTMTSSVTASEASPTENLAISLSILAAPCFSQPLSSPSQQSVEQADAMDITEAKPSIPGILEPHPPSVSVVEMNDEARGDTMSGVTFPSASTQVPVVLFDTKEQVTLWKLLLLRILDSQKQVASSGGNELRFILLARFLRGSDPGDEVWDILLKHILSDYQNHRGHELVLHTLYHLFADQEIHKVDSSDQAVTAFAYDRFFLSVAEGVRDTLPPSDKSLSKLLGEAPALPVGAMELLEGLCNPVGKGKEGLESAVVERITQGLSAVWSLILLRPSIRSECLNVALKCTVHEVEEVRTKAIRLVANKLYPLPYISQGIEEYATNMLYTVLDMINGASNGTSDLTANDGLASQEFPTDQVTGKVANSKTLTSNLYALHDDSCDDDELKNGKTSVSVQEAQRCMSLYFALCTKKHSLLREIFDIYERSPKAVKQAVHKHLPVLIRTIGASSLDVLQIISDPPAGSKNLIFLVLHVLTELSSPPPELISAVKQLYESRMKDARLLVPILSSLSKEEVLPIFPNLVALPAQDFKGALDRILQGSVHTGPALTPAEVLIAIHSIDPERDHVPLSMVKDACAVCFQQRTVFTQQVLAKVLNQLVEQTPLPMLFMRTVIQAVGSFRSLVSFVMEILSRLVSKQVWKWPNLWIGFLKCAEQTQPHSLHVLLQLPALHLEKALVRHPNLRAPLTKHASKPGIRSTLPRSTLLVLELAQDVGATESVQSAPVCMSTPSSNPDLETQVSESAKTS